MGRVLSENELWDLSKVNESIFLVKNEVRPVAEVVVPKSLQGEVARCIGESSLHRLVTPRGSTHLAVYIFVWPHLSHVARKLAGLPYDKTAVFHWCAGKAFGYSEAKISEFLQSRKTR